MAYAWTLYGRTLQLSSISLALAGIISALVFGALTGFLWDRFRAKRLAEERKGSPVLLVSFIFGGINLGSIGYGIHYRCAYWRGSCNKSLIFGGRTYLLRWLSFSDSPAGFSPSSPGERRKVDKSGFKWGVAGGVIWH